MGRSVRPKPKRLAAKLAQIRRQLDLSQEGMLDRLNYRASPLYASQISDFENGKREPPLAVLLKYARVAGLTIDDLVDDEIELPTRLGVKKKRKRK